MYSKERSDPFCRLRVPLYLKCFEVLFFAAFIALYYVVLIQKSSIHHLTVPEVLLYVWLLALRTTSLENTGMLDPSSIRETSGRYGI